MCFLLIDSVFYLAGIVVVILLIAVVLFSAMPTLLRITGHRTFLFRKFIEKNDGFFSVAFMVLFTVEQITLIFLLYIFKDQTRLIGLIVSVFAVFVVTTAALEKFFLETKRRYDRESKVSIESSNRIIESSNRIIERCRRLLDLYRKRVDYYKNRQRR